MKVTSFAKATAFLGAAALVASAGVAQAQVDKVNAKCRATIQKNAGKLAATASKTIDGCQKGQIKSPSAADCNSLAVADTKGKVAKAVAKLTGAVGGAKSKCDDTTHAASLAMFPSCPSPANADDDGPPTAGVDTFTEVGACEATLNTDSIETARRYMLDPDFIAVAAATRAKEIGKCIGAVGKNVTKLIKTVGKTRGKCQASSDKGGGAFAYGCSTNDTKGKIAKARTKLESGIDKACGAPKVNLTAAELGLVGGCAADIAGLKSCLVSSATKVASGLTATAFEFDGVCPANVLVSAKTGFSGGAQVSATALDVGFTGFGLRAGVPDGFTGSVALGCATGDCASCSVLNACVSNNCRCSNDVTQICTDPLVESTCGTGNTCEVLFSFPLPLAAAGTPTCVVNKIVAELNGTADIGTGVSTTVVSDKAIVHLGISQDQPCPTCDGGTCTGGPRNGLPCTVDGTHETFGDLSYDCPPDSAANVTGTGLDIALTFTDAATSLPFATSCDYPLASFDCACAQCSHDNTVACVDDAECDALSTGSTCTASTGASRAPNGCTNLAGCNSVGGGNGECDAAGPDDSFCAGLVKPNGDGFIPCATDGDCSPFGAGTCTATVRRPCFLDPITTDGTPGQDGAILGGTFCIPPTASAAVNGAAGTAGPGRVVIDWDFTGLCSDGVTEWELGGSNCP